MIWFCYCWPFLAQMQYVYKTTSSTQQHNLPLGQVLYLHFITILSSGTWAIGTGETFTRWCIRREVYQVYQERGVPGERCTRCTRREVYQVYQERGVPGEVKIRALYDLTGQENILTRSWNSPITFPSSIRNLPPFSASTIAAAWVNAWTIYLCTQQTHRFNWTIYTQRQIKLNNLPTQRDWFNWTIYTEWFNWISTNTDETNSKICLSSHNVYVPNNSH